MRTPLRRGAVGAVALAGLLVAVSSSAWAADATTEPATDYDKTSMVITSGDAAHLVDSVTAGPLAAAQLSSILLTGSTSLNSEAKAALAAKKPQVVYIVGGTSAVASSEEAEISAAVSGVTIYRVAGNDRYATAHAVSDLVEKMYSHYDSSN